MAFIANEGVAPKGDRYDRSSLVNDTEGKLYKKTEYGDFIYRLLLCKLKKCVCNKIFCGSAFIHSFIIASFLKKICTPVQAST